MLSIVKPADVLKYIGAMLGIVIGLMLPTGVVVNLLSGVSLWQRLALAAIGIVL